MSGGRNLLLLSSAVAVASCSANHQVQVRAIPSPGSTSKTGGDLLAQARGQLALGDVGLALESLRTLQREQPENPDVFEGIARCYAAMGRYDLVRANLESALAYAPNDSRLLNELAGSLDQLGEPDRAVQVREEAARLLSPPAAHVVTEQSAITPLGVPRIGSVTVKLPPPTSSTNMAAIRPASPSANSATQTQSGRPIPRIVAANTVVDVAAAPASLPTPHTAGGMMLKAETVVELATPAAAKPFVVTHVARVSAPNNPVTALHAQVSSADHAVLSKINIQQTGDVPEPSAPSRTPAPIPVQITLRPKTIDDHMLAPGKSVEFARSNTRVEGGPHLERTSRGEVALITTSPDIRMAQLEGTNIRLPAIASTPPVRPSTPLPQTRRQQLAALNNQVKWIPLRYASIPQNVELLNAARRDGLAARMRIALQDRGWRKIQIGNARRIRQQSVVLYSGQRVQIAHRLAAQFRCASVKVAGLKNIVVLLGRDAALRRSLSARA